MLITLNHYYSKTSISVRLALFDIIFPSFSLIYFKILNTLSYESLTSPLLKYVYLTILIIKSLNMDWAISSWTFSLNILLILLILESSLKVNFIESITALVSITAFFVETLLKFSSIESFWRFTASSKRSLHSRVVSGLDRLKS